jgi:P4 family phage/plasmid primase-like protien
MKTTKTPQPVTNTKNINIEGASLPSNPMASKYSKKYSEYMKNHLVGETGLSITNTRIGSEKPTKIYGGSYHISVDDYPAFLNLYSSDIMSKNMEEYLTEKQLVEKAPILVDIDLHFPFSTKSRVYTESHIEDLVDIYLAEFKTIFQFENDTAFKVWIFEKDNVNPVSEKNITKDGIHMIVGIQTDHVMQAMLRKRVMPKVADAWSDFPIVNTWEDVFDKGISDGTTNWQLYGSRKPNHAQYKLTRVYEITYDDADGELMRNTINLDDYDVSKNIYELSARYDKHPSFFYTSEFVKQLDSNPDAGKSRPANRAGNRLIRVDGNSTLCNIKNREELQSAVNDFLDSLLPSEYELRETYDYTMVLPDTYYGSGSYNKWVRVGFALRNISDKLFIVWIALSALSPTFDFNSISDMYSKWQSLDTKNPNGLTKRSIMHWAKEDAHVEFKKVQEKSIDYHLDRTLKSIHLENIGGDKNSRGCGDYDLATVLFELHKEEFVCVSVTSGIWYRIRGHCWQKNDAGTTLRNSISTTLRNLYWKKAQNMMLMANSLNPPDEEKSKRMQEHANKILEICARLGRTNEKNNIMREAKELFYDCEFLDKLDQNPYLLSCANGVVDFKTKIFRKGYPDDHLSKCTKIDYVPLDREKQKSIIAEVEEFMYMLFPDEQLRKYMWEHLASVLIGTASQTFNMYVGIGANGKSVLTDLIKECLGEYKGDVPLSVITDKRGKVGGLAPEIVALKGIRYALMQEPQEGDQINEGVMKQLTSGFDPIIARAPYMPEMITFIPQFKLVVCTNVFMEIKSQDHGTWRRIRVVDFESLFTNTPVHDDPAKPYQFLKNDKINERFPLWKEVFLAMLVEIAFKTEGKVNDCVRVCSASNAYKEQNDYVAEFIKSRMIADENGSVSKAEITNEFAIWYKTTHGQGGPTSKKLHSYMDKKYGNYDKHKAWVGVRINYDVGRRPGNVSTTTSDDEVDTIGENDL